MGPMPRADPVGIGITGDRLRRAVTAGAAEPTSAELVEVDSATLSGGLALVAWADRRIAESGGKR